MSAQGWLLVKTIAAELGLALVVFAVLAWAAGSLRDVQIRRRARR